MNRLVHEVNSQFIEAANRLRPKGTRKRIVAYVESYQDIAFWRLLLDEFESAQYTFSIMLPSHGKLLRGKKSAIAESIGADRLGGCMIACVDSDYDYLMQGCTKFSKEFLQSEFVLHTYTYAIENYMCYSGSLNQVCVQCSLNDYRPVDFEAFFELYSETIFPLFAWNIWFYRHGRHNEFPMQEFNNCIAIDEVNVHEPARCFERLRTRVSRKLSFLEQKYPDVADQVANLKPELVSLGVEPSQTYLYIQGHFLYERVLMKLMEPVLAYLRRGREQEIIRQAVHAQQKQNELSSYRHAQAELGDAVRENTHYRESAQYQRMRADVASLLKRVSRNSE